MSSIRLGTRVQTSNNTQISQKKALPGARTNSIVATVRLADPRTARRQAAKQSL